MANRLKQILRHLGQTLPAGGVCPTDGQLLARFIASRDEEAFTTFVLSWRDWRRRPHPSVQESLTPCS